MRPSRPVAIAFAAVSMLPLLAPLPACKDHGKESAARAASDVAWIGALVDKDVGEIARGMPEGAKKLATLVSGGADPRADAQGVRKALQRMRRDVMDLNVAKSTFFALADASGVAIRNDLEEDTMAGQNLAQIFPALARAKDAYTVTVGSFPSASTKSGPDEDWVAAAPVRRDDGTTGALLVTGWSYRYFSRHLQEALKSKLADEAKAAGNEGRLPVFYVAIFDKTGVYSSPLTPQIDEQALSNQRLVDKTAAGGGVGGAAQGALDITDRSFGWAAMRTPQLAPDTGVVVLRSEL